jgi:hypothetical protein
MLELKNLLYAVMERFLKTKNISSKKRKSLNQSKDIFLRKRKALQIEKRKD